MAIKNHDGTFRCSYCSKKYYNIQLADSCRDNHDLVYIQIARSDLNRLINFIYSHDEALLTATMINSLKQKLKGEKDAVSGLFEDNPEP